jgi:trafficking protein particle complex subunit 12
MQQLTGVSGAPPPDPTDHARIFSLLYTRLACLTLIDATSVAAQEVKALEDLNSAFYYDEVTAAHLVPWELRVLNVRLQALGFGDPRRAVMSYYDLAREARAHIADAMGRHDNSASELWKDRLYELGVQVAGALIEMEDLAGAAVQLGSLRDRGDGKATMARALLWLHLGDSDAARRCIGDDESAHKIISALSDMADGDYASALRTWQELREDTTDEMIDINVAVCLLYVGRMEEVTLAFMLHCGAGLRTNGRAQ